MQQYKKQLILIASFIILSLITGVATYGLTQKNKTSAKTTASDSTTYTTDKTTGQKLDTSASQTPETYSKNPASPILVGFDALTNLGITTADISTFQSGITQYFVSTTDYSPASKVALKDPSCQPPNNDGFVVCAYSLVVNDTATLTGTLKTDLSGPVSVTISKSTVQVFSTTVNS